MALCSGVDSLQAIGIRGSLIPAAVKNGASPDNISPLLVYEHPSTSQLAKFINSPMKLSTDPVSSVIRAAVDKYSADLPYRSSNESTDTVENAVFMITGSAGSFGCHVLSALHKRGDISKIYCLCRPATTEDIISKHKRTFAYYGLDASILNDPTWNIEFLGIDLSRSDLGL